MRHGRSLLSGWNACLSASLRRCSRWKARSPGSIAAALSVLQRLQKAVERPVADLAAEVGAVADGAAEVEPDVDAGVADLVGQGLEAVVAADDPRRAGRGGRAEGGVLAKEPGQDLGRRTAEAGVGRRVLGMERCRPQRRPGGVGLGRVVAVRIGERGSPSPAARTDRCTCCPSRRWWRPPWPGSAGRTAARSRPGRCFSARSHAARHPVPHRQRRLGAAQRDLGLLGRAGGCCPTLPSRLVSLKSAAHSSLLRLGGPSARNWSPRLSTNGVTKRQAGMLGFPKVGGVRWYSPGPLPKV